MKNIKILSALLVMLVGSSCAYVAQKVEIDPVVNVDSENIGLGKKIVVSVKDERPDDLIGHRGAAFGKAAKIQTDVNMVQVFENKIIQGLQVKGFMPMTETGESEAQLNVEIRLVEYSTSTGFWTGGVQTKSAIKVYAYNGEKSFEKLYRIEKEKRVVIVPTADANEKMINEIIASVLEEMFNDRNLLDFLAQ